MGLPKQVQQDIKDIAEMERQLGAAEPEATPVAPEAPAPEAVVGDQPPVATPNQPEVKPEDDAEVWKQKYRTLKGMFDADVPRLHSQVKQLTAEVTALTQKLEQKPAEPTPDAPKLVTAADVETFGADLVDLQRRIAQEVSATFQGQLEALSAQNAELKQKLDQTGTRVGEMTFEQRLNRAVPDFDAINADPTWVGWLDEVDPLLRAPRRVVAQEAFDNGDVEAIAHYVSLFRQSAQPVPQDTKRQDELERQVTPTRISAASSTAPQGKVYTVASWGTAYNRVAQLNAQGKYDEATKLEAELDAAANEGRVAA